MRVSEPWASARTPGLGLRRNRDRRGSGARDGQSRAGCLPVSRHRSPTGFYGHSENIPSRARPSRAPRGTPALGLLCVSCPQAAVAIGASKKPLSWLSEDDTIVQLVGQRAKCGGLAMMSQSQNDAITRTGRETGLGKLMRRYWQPVALVQELAGERPIVPVRLLGQDFVVFRDEQGRYCMLDRDCPHRGADLAFG